jgi:hypothetical protein
MLFVLQVTSLSGVTRRDPGCVRSSSEPALFASAVTVVTLRRFQGTEWRSVPLPISQSRLRFGTVSCTTHWQALAGLSWLSFSQPADLPLVSGPVRPGFDRHRSKAPHASQVVRGQ